MNGKSQKRTISCPECQKELEVSSRDVKVPQHSYPDLPYSTCPGSGRTITDYVDFKGD